MTHQTLIFCLVLLVVTLTPLTEGHQLRIVNGCPFTIWIGLLNNPKKALPANGGFRLNEWQVRTVDVDYEWGGRVWARTGCDGSGKCETGDCGHRLECRGAGGRPPVSLAEFTFDGWAGGQGVMDYYDVSLVDGYNLPISITPIDGTFQKKNGGKYDCSRAGCYSDLNAKCPSELAIKNGGGWTVACMSACDKFRTDQYCCRGAHNRPATCQSSHWPKNYPAIYKQACPDAYSYAYDDQTSTFTCRSSSWGSSSYEIKFCP